MCGLECDGCVAVEATESEVNTSEVSKMDRSEMAGMGEVTDSFSEDVDWREDNF